MDVDRAWEMWAVQDPYFSVLTDPKFRSAALTPQAREEFFALGRLHVDHVLGQCRRHVDPTFSPARVLDFGCGVGRVTIPFAAVAAEVVGMDIAPSMLEEARRNCDAQQIGNVALVLSDDELSAAPGQFDLVHSCIVLQHIEIERGRRLFAALVDKVRPGGCGAIQVTFGFDVYASTFGVKPLPLPPVPPSPSLRLRRWTRAQLEVLGWRRRAAAAGASDPATGGDPEMQMNFYNLSELMFILEQRGIVQVFGELTNHGGALGTFLFFGR